MSLTGCLVNEDVQHQILLKGQMHAPVANCSHSHLTFSH